MRIAIVSVCDHFTHEEERCLRHNASFCDFTAVAWTGASSEERRVLLHRLGREVDVLYDGSATHSSPGFARLVCRNVNRLFRPEYLLVLSGRECLEGGDRATLEDALGRLGASAGSLEIGETVGAPDLRAFSGVAVDSWDTADDAPQDRPDVRPLDGFRLSVKRLEGGEDGTRRAAVESERLGLLIWADHSVWPARPGIDSHSPPLAEVADSGAIEPEYHRRNLYLDLPPFEHLRWTYRPESFLDLGCGLGGYVDAMRRWGIDDVLGVDDFRATDDLLAPEAFRRCDLTREQHFGRTFGLVACTEVLEHIEPRHEDLVLDNIARHAGSTIVFSAARPNQPGVGHVNYRPPEYWIEAWRSRGWVVDVFQSLALRSLASFYWFRRNLLVLRPESKTPVLVGGFSAADLRSMEFERTPWFGEAARVYLRPLTVDLPAFADAAGSSQGDAAP